MKWLIITVLIFGITASYFKNRRLLVCTIYIRLTLTVTVLGVSTNVQATLHSLACTTQSIHDIILGTDSAKDVITMLALFILLRSSVLQLLHRELNKKNRVHISTGQCISTFHRWCLPMVDEELSNLDNDREWVVAWPPQLPASGFFVWGLV